MKPLLSIIVPVYREGHAINPFLAHIFALTPDPFFEVILVDGARKADTVKAIMPSIKRDPRLKTAISPKGRAVQMNKGAAMAEGETFLFLHADTFICQEVIDRIISTCTTAEWAGGAFDFAIRSDRRFLKLISKIACIRTRMTKIPYGDQAIFLKRSIFSTLGGFASIPLMEDVDIMRRIKKKGWKIRISSIPVETSARRWETEGAVLGTLRNWTLMTLYLMGVSPEKLAKFYPFTTP